jgi:hypothetical protein
VTNAPRKSDSARSGSAGQPTEGEHRHNDQEAESETELDDHVSVAHSLGTPEGLGPAKDRATVMPSGGVLRPDGTVLVAHPNGRRRLTFSRRTRS